MLRGFEEEFREYGHVNSGPKNEKRMENKLVNSSYFVLPVFPPKVMLLNPQLL